ncbi:MAG: RecX family transcriptional regulator [Amoebophilaceae bacterium]|nr:RecX family transcriptional regulator [Amoebophilaceae bacterium]
MALDKSDAVYQKAMRYCSYQERTVKEVQEKLRGWGVEGQNEAPIIQALKEDRFLDEGRYIAAFIRGKFLGKKWGKEKLAAVLTSKGLDQVLVRQGLAMIEDADYIQSLRDVAERRSASLVEVTPTEAKRKLMNYLFQKGYEFDLVLQTVQEIIVP